MGERRTLYGRLAKRHDGGIGACHAVRRDVALAMGGYDERFGAGGPFGSAEDGEFAYRVLREGRAIALEPAARVLHRRRVPWSDGPRYGRAVGRSLGAIYGVHTRTGDMVAPLMLGWELRRMTARMLAPLLRGGRPQGAGQLLGLLTGFAQGLHAGRAR